MTAILRGRAAAVNVVLEEGSLFDPTFHNLADGATDQSGPHEPFEEYSVAYFTAQTETGGQTIFELGPAEDDLDGTCIVLADEGIIECDLSALRSIGFPLDPPRYTGYFNLVIYPGGDEARAMRFAEGNLIYMRRATDRPQEES